MKHQKRPIFLNTEHGNIGRPPSYKDVGKPSVQAYQYMKNWLQNQQLFSYSASRDSEGGDTTTQGNFYVILHNAGKDDTSNPKRQLEGVLLPWYYEPDYAGGVVTTPVKVEWIHGGLTEVLISWGSEKPHASTLPWSECILLGSSNVEKFEYTPEGSGEWTYGILRTTNIKTAALGIWPGPDWTLTDDQARTLLEYYAPGNLIIGGTGVNKKVDELISGFGNQVLAGWDNDGLERNMVRCLYQWGHDVGVWTDYATASSYVNIGGSGATYKIRVPEYYSYASDEIEVYPTIIVTPSGAGGGDKAYVKISSSTAADTWEFSTEVNSLALYDYKDVAGYDTLTVDTSDEEEITIEVKVDSGVELLLHTVALWVHPFGVGDTP